MCMRIERVRVKPDGADLLLDDFESPAWWRGRREMLDILEWVSCRRDMSG